MLRIFNIAEVEEDMQRSSLPLVSQSKMSTAHHSIVEPLLNTLGSLHLEVQDEGKHGNMYQIKSRLVVFCHLTIFLSVHISFGSHESRFSPEEL